MKKHQTMKTDPFQAMLPNVKSQHINHAG